MPELDGKHVGEVIGAQFPEFRAASVAYLGEGYDSTAFEVDAAWVFRFPKRSEVERQLLLEMRILPALAEQSPVPVPVFRFQGKPSPLFPRHFGGYAMLPGVPAIGLVPEAMAREAWAPVLARFLSWLHTVPVAQAIELGVPRQDVGAVIDEARADALHDLGALAATVPDRALDDCRAFLSAAPAALVEGSATEVLIHGDLAAEHVLYDPTSLAITGIIDWSEIAVGDPALDVAALFHWGGREFVDIVLSSYVGPVDELMLRRAQYLAACRGVADIVFGLERDRRVYVEAGLRALGLTIGVEGSQV